MKYYKIIKDKVFIGAITSDYFIKYQPVLKCFLRSDEMAGEYVDFNCFLYRDTWMRPITQQREFIQASILAISEEEYNMYIEAIKNNEAIEESIPEEEQVQEITSVELNANDAASIEFIRDSKIKEMSATCRKTIENGFDITLSDNEVHHFSLDTQDQLNLITLSSMAETQEMIPYHADNELCKFYSAAEIKAIVDGAAAHKTYHTTYYNALKNYINSLNTIEEINAITYGTPIPEEYKSDVLRMLENENVN